MINFSTARLAIVSFTGAVALAATSAFAMPVVGDAIPVGDGGFEKINSANQSDPDGWSVINPGGEFFTTDGGVSPVGGNRFGIQQLTGWKFHNGVDRYNAGGVYQDISGLQIGAQYDLTFYSSGWFDPNSRPDSQFNWNVTFGDQMKGGTVLTKAMIASDNRPNWVKDTLSFVATAETQTLTFAGIFLNFIPGKSPEILNLDGVALTYSAPPPPGTEVPEPGTAVLAGLGLVCALAVYRRRKIG